MEANTSTERDVEQNGQTIWVIFNQTSQAEPVLLGHEINYVPLTVPKIQPSSVRNFG